MKQNKFKIEKKVPLPELRGGGECKYPFADMKVGDSFACNRAVLERARVAASTYGKRNNMKFTARRTSGDDARIWRIE
jgi:hypothetical protein